MMMTKLETTEKIENRFLVGQPCEDDSIDAADYQKKFIAAVEEGLAELDRGEFVTLEEIKKEFSSWGTR
ncbi:MAG: hypothetical protein NT164_05970 [Verrucomicrobiae bacterium]|nr:hypothetical protein [Verrucomicrobiae bacterium]